MIFKFSKENESVDLGKPISNKNLSMGQMQKISFIRALVSGVNILVLDESTSNLDNDSKALIYNILNNMELTIINSTHSPEDFMNFNSHLRIDEGNKGKGHYLFKEMSDFYRFYKERLNFLLK